jgi:hypothetical protein
MSQSQDELKREHERLETVGGPWPIVAAVLIAIVVGLVVWLVRDAYRHNNHSPSTKIAQDASTLQWTPMGPQSDRIPGRSGAPGLFRPVLSVLTVVTTLT